MQIETQMRIKMAAAVGKAASSKNLITGTIIWRGLRSPAPTR